MSVPVTERSATSLARSIRVGEISAREVVDAHLALLEQVNPRINAVVVPRFEQAREQASAADARIARAGTDEELPPLLGVPCTIKESIAVAGMPNCAGLVARRDVRAEKTAPTAQRLLDAGAILVGLTNTSELTMWIESHNHVYGRTHNAYDRRRIAGGSSGGEGAVVGSGGVPIGLGSDIGGSIRLPAFFNGVFGHKATAGLVPNSGQFPVTRGESGRLLGVGPLARRGEDLMPLLRLLAGADPDDPLSRDDVTLGDPADVSLAGLPVTLIEGRLIPPVSKELRAACDRAAGVLEDAGARVRRLPLRRLGMALEPYLATLKDGAGTTTAQILSEAGVDVRARDLVRRGAPHTTATKLLIAAESSFGRLPPGRTRRAVESGKRLAAEVEELVGDGVLLHPPFGRPAPRHGTTVGRPWKILHAAVFNLAGLPATQTPLGLGKRGLPLGVQVVAGRDRDHVGIAVALELERALGGWVPPGRGARSPGARDRTTATATR